MKLIFLLILTMTLASCAMPHWDKPGGTEKSFADDRYACLKDSAVIQDQFMSSEMFSQCMKYKGWTLR